MQHKIKYFSRSHPNKPVQPQEKGYHTDDSCAYKIKPDDKLYLLLLSQATGKPRYLHILGCELPTDQ